MIIKLILKEGSRLKKRGDEDVMSELPEETGKYSFNANN